MKTTRKMAFLSVTALFLSLNLFSSTNSNPVITGFGGFGVALQLGVPFKITVNGSGFQSGAVTGISGPGTTLSSSSFINSGKIEIDVVFTMASSASTQTVTVTNPDGGTGSKTFTVGTINP
jgi:hypothetical protein